MTRRDALRQALIPASLFAMRQAPGAEPRTAIENVTVIDGLGGLTEDRAIVLSGGRIESVLQASPVALPDVPQVDCRGCFVIPGLIDAHAHLSYFKAGALPVLLANGVTTVRDMGGLLRELDRWRTQIETGVRPGPRIRCAGPILNGKEFNQFQVAVTDASEARGAVKVLRHSGVDFIKVHAAIARDAYFGVQAECRRLQLPYVGHMPRAITPEEASDAGQLTLEHVGAFLDRFVSQGVAIENGAAELKRFRQEKARALFERFARNRTWFTPTLITSKIAIHLGDHRPDPRDQYVSASCKKITEELLTRPNFKEYFQPAAIARQQREFDELLPLVGLMNKWGVGLLAGTDFALSIIYPGFSLHEELELLVAAGLRPMAALQTATSNLAQVLHEPDLGVIRPGAYADLVVLEANPLSDIRNTRRIRAVVSRGKMYTKPDLDGLLADAATEARVT